MAEAAPEEAKAGGLELIYFNMEARAGAIRVALHHAGIPFTDTRIPFSEWPERKATVPGGALPYLLMDGKPFAQSSAIARWAGRQTTLYPADPLAGLKVDEIMDFCDDVLAKCPHDPDPEVKKAKREEYAAGKMKSYFDVLAAKASEDEFIAGPDLTIADIMLYFMAFFMLRTGDFDHVPADYTDAWPALSALETKIKEHPIMVAYMASEYSAKK